MGLCRGLHKSDEPRMGWYDSSMVRGGSDFKVDIKRDYRGDIKDFREYFMGLKVFRWTQEELMWVRNGQGGCSLTLK